jgi:hypothetical protein
VGDTRTCLPRRTRVGLFRRGAAATAPALATLLALTSPTATTGLGGGAATGPLLATALVRGRHGVSSPGVQQALLPAVTACRRRGGPGITPRRQRQPGPRFPRRVHARRGAASSSSESSMRRGRTCPARQRTLRTSDGTRGRLIGREDAEPAGLLQSASVETSVARSLMTKLHDAARRSRWSSRAWNSCASAKSTPVDQAKVMRPEMAIIPSRSRQFAGRSYSQPRVV